MKFTIGQCNLSTSFLHEVTLVSEKLLHHYQVYWSKRVAEWKSIIRGRNGPSFFLCKNGAKPSDIHRPLSAVCGEKSPARSTELKNWQEN